MDKKHFANKLGKNASEKSSLYNRNLSENEEELKWRRYNNMKIEGNQKELDAMVEFHKGNRVEGLRLQEEFAAEFRKEYKDKDHCPCLKACRYHGNCKECVAIHRAHQEHVPNCMRPLINKKLKLMSELTEHTLANEIEAPHEILKKIGKSNFRLLRSSRERKIGSLQRGERC